MPVSKYMYEFDVTPNVFPNGLWVPTLIRKLRVIVNDPALLGDISGDSPNNYDPVKGYVSGEFTIISAQVMSAAMLVLIEDEFETHAGLDGRNPKTPTLEMLPEPSAALAVQCLCPDAPTGVDNGVGCLVYSNGSAWLRVSDNIEVQS